jgi:hypothetical protein
MIGLSGAVKATGPGRLHVLGLWLIAAVILSACTAQAAGTPRPSAGIVARGAVLEFRPYTSPQGYVVSVPVRATGTEEPNGSARFVVDDSNGPYGMYSIEVVRGPATGLDVYEVIDRDVPPGDAATTPERLERGTRFGVARSFEIDGVTCPTVRVFEAAAVVDDVGYLLRVTSDAPGRCDAAILPETAPIVESFQTAP